MKIALCSDTHNEFYASPPDLPQVDADFLVLAGDIQTPQSHNFDWWARLSDQYKAIFYIPGNHEYYKTYFSDYPELNFPDNIVLAGFSQENSFFTHLGCNILACDGYKVLMGTMWSDLSEPMASMLARERMNDYRRIKYSRDRYWFTPEDTTNEFIKFKTALAKIKPDIVITHHAPSFRSLNPVYGGKENYLNKAYYSDIDLNGIKLWMHGHSHYPVDYIQDGCRVVSNPMGYPGEVPNFNMKVITI